MNMEKCTGKSHARNCSKFQNYNSKKRCILYAGIFR